MKIKIYFPILLCLVFLCVACGGGSSDHGYSGTWKVKGGLVDNDGNLPDMSAITNQNLPDMPATMNYELKVDQDGKDVVVFDGLNTYVGSTRGIDEPIKDGFAAEYKYPSGVVDEIRITGIKGDEGVFSKYLMIPINCKSLDDKAGCAIGVTYRGTAQRIDRNKIESEEQENSNDEF